jgi:regulatory protein
MKKTGSSKPENKQYDFKSALHRAATLCSRQELCTQSIRDKLRNWNVGQDDAEKIIRKLQQEKFLDDNRYAGFYARDKFRLNGWGRVKIAHMLRQKGIGEADIEQALALIDEETYFQSCLDLIRSKSAALHEKNEFIRKGKLFRFAAGRGFEPELIHKALNTSEKE